MAPSKIVFAKALCASSRTVALYPCLAKHVTVLRSLFPKATPLRRTPGNHNDDVPPRIAHRFGRIGAGDLDSTARHSARRCWYAETAAAIGQPAPLCAPKYA